MRRLPSIVLLAALSLATGTASAQTAALIAKGQKDLDAGRYGEALRQGGLVIAKYPKRWEGHRLVGRAAFLLDRPDRAEAAFRKAIALAPPPIKPSLQKELLAVAPLRLALGHLKQARALKSDGDDPGAARAQESAYRALPARYAYGLTAAELFETAGLLDDARRVLEDVRKRHASAKALTRVDQRLAALDARVETIRKLAEEEAARKQEEERKAEEDRKAEAERVAAEKARKAKEAERRRIEEERRAEEERQKAEKERLDREETARLNRVLDDLKREVTSAESAIRQGEDAVSAAQRDVRRIDNDLDDARDARNRAKRERDKWEDKIRDAKTEMERNVFRNDLRSAESAYDDAKAKYDRIDNRLDAAKSRLSQAQSDVDSARRRLSQAQQDVRDTEAALARLASGG